MDLDVDAVAAVAAVAAARRTTGILVEGAAADVVAEQRCQVTRLNQEPAEELVVGDSVGSVDFV